MRKALSRLVRSRRVIPVSGLLGFLEGSFILFPIQPLFIPMMVSRGRSGWVISLWLVIGNVAGAALMYAFGMWLLEPVIEPFVAWMGAEGSWESASERLRDNAFLTVFAIGLTPFPFQVGTAAAGTLGMNIPLFILAVATSRSILYFGLWLAVLAIGQRAKDVVAKYELEIFIAGIVIFAVLAAWILLV